MKSAEWSEIISVSCGLSEGILETLTFNRGHFGLFKLAQTYSATKMTY